MKQTHRYDDIIDLPRPVSGMRARMPVSDRAAQFAAFAALTGHDEAIGETARLTDAFIVLDEEEKVILDRKIRMLQDRADQHPLVTVIYFCEDKRKEGGAYIQITGNVRKVDERQRLLIFTDGTAVCIEKIYTIS